MKIRGLFFCLTAILFSLSVYSQGNRVKFEIDNFEENTLILGYHFGKQRLILDTVSVDAGNIDYISDSKLKPGIYFLYSPKFYYEFVFKEEFISIKTDAIDPVKNAKIIDSYENKLFIDFQLKMGQIQKEQRRNSQLLDSLSGSDSVKVRERMSTLATSINNFQDSVVENHSTSYVAAFVSLMRGKKIPEFDEISDTSDKRTAKYRYLKTHYFDGVDIGKMMRTPVIHGYVEKYFDDLVVPNPDSLKKEIKIFLDDLLVDQQAFRYWLVTLFNKYQESNLMGMDAVTAFLVENYYLSEKVDWMSEDAKSEMKKELRFIKPNLIGSEAPRLNLLDTGLQSWSLSRVKAPFVVLYFYDPDCGVCRKKTPILQENYENIKSAGAEVVAVCTITDQQRWKEYINQKDLNWVNVADPFYKSNFRMDYNVRSTPQLYILNSSREIIAKKLDVDQVVDFIRDYKELEAKK